MNPLKALSLIFLGFLVFSSCNKSMTAQTHNSGNSTENNPSEEAPIPDEIAYLFLTMQEDAGISSIELSELKMYEGKLKAQQPQIRNQQYLLLASFKDAEGEEVLFIELDHPLYPTYEVPSESGQLETQTLSLDRTEFTLRYQHNPSISSVSFSEQIRGQTVPLNSIILNP